MTTTFIGIFPDKQIAVKDSLFLLNEIPYLEYSFKKELHREFKTPSGYVCLYWKYTPINSDGTKRILEAGNFEIIDIEPDEGDRNFAGRNIRVSENNGQRVHTYRSLTGGINFITQDLLPLINTLIMTGKWEIFTDLIRLKKLESENELLKNKIKEQRKTIDELQLELGELKT